MLSLIKKLFAPTPVRAKAPQSRSPQQFEHSGIIPAVEVANLNLAAILERLPDELKPLILKQPEATVTVALPIASIVKQLPSGSVKVSLATVHRQAPAGVFGPLPPGDKRMIEVPLAEVFKHIKPTTFKRRNDQRTAAALDSKFNLFGDAQNPYQIAPTVPEDEVEPAAPEPRVPPPLRMERVATPTPFPTPAAPVQPIAPPAFTPPRETPPLQFKLARDPEPEPIAEAAPAVEAPPVPVVEAAPQVEPVAAPEAPRAITPPPNFLEPKIQTPPTPEPLAAAAPPTVPPVAPPTIGSDSASIAVPVEPLSGAWPEAIRNEIATLNGSARVSLPKSDVTAGLARGKVIFSWGQIRSWIEPALGESSAADAATELILPLKVVAPVFLAASSKPKAEQRAPEIDSDIPALFSDGRAPAAEPEPEAPPTPEPPSEAPAPEAPSAPVAESAPAAISTPEPEPFKTPQTVGELFGQPEKLEWTPAEMVSLLASRPGVSGAVVALQEGLLVAHSLPGDVKSDVIAAFLPQLFARLNQYSGEMKLGEVDDLLFTTHGAHCQIYRLGYVYFAVLGKPGEQLPWTELRLVADELARQTQKA